ncbi:MAG: DUF2232 domain-containing protein [Chromatiales bacterium]
MRALAAWMMRGRLHAAAIGAASCLLGWLLMPLMPVFSCLSGAVVSLVTLRHGLIEGLGVAALAAGMLALVSLLVNGTLAPALWLALVLWLPAQLCALVLRQTRDQGWTLLTAGLLAAMFAGGLRIATGDVQAWWRRMLDVMMQAAATGGGVPGVTESHLDLAAGALNALVAASMTATLMLTVLLGRYWQALLYNPGGLGREFRALCMPRAPALVVAVVALVALVLKAQVGVQVAALGFVLDVMAIGVSALAFQGLALTHHEVDARGLSPGWLAVPYALLAVVPHYIGLLLAALGLADLVLDFRNRHAAGTRK